MKRMLALVLVLMLVLPVFPRAEEKNPALTEKEIRDGWLLLFDGETMFGWKIDGEAKVEKGALILGGTKRTRAEVTTFFNRYRVKLTWEGKGKGSAFVRVGGLDLGVGASTGTVECSDASNDKPHSPLVVDVPAGTKVSIQDARLRPRTKWEEPLVPLFNGKNLDGWQIFAGKGRKSKYTVTAEGWLNVKDGPGDLQTKKQFSDFVLQLECISNGKHLNSGIFFRCIPGEYQQGYEAQIHNGFTDKPKKVYTIEEHDPKTHKSLGKKKVAFTATDYGTGAIYRRMPARRAVAKDGEWFAMTVVARGRHLSTWVNGIQVVDWVDHRPAHDNPRQGYRAAAGAISIQGHDPTTDLSFRNIRIAELPPEKP